MLVQQGLEHGPRLPGGIGAVADAVFDFQGHLRDGLPQGWQMKNGIVTETVLTFWFELYHSGNRPDDRADNRASRSGDGSHAAEAGVAPVPRHAVEILQQQRDSVGVGLAGITAVARGIHSGLTP